MVVGAIHLVVSETKKGKHTHETSVGLALLTVAPNGHIMNCMCSAKPHIQH